MSDKESNNGSEGAIPEVVENLKNTPKRSRAIKPRDKGNRLTKTRIAKILQRSIAGESRRDVARAANCTPQAVQEVINIFRPILDKMGHVPAFRESKADILDAMQMQAAQSVMDVQKHADANLRDATYCLDVLHKIGRLERGQSTTNTAVTYCDVAKVQD